MGVVAIVKDGLVENVIVLEEGSTWTPPDGAVLVPVGPTDAADPGGTYDSEGFHPAPPPPGVEA